MTVLVVEDDEIILDSLRYSLVQAGYTVTAAGSVAEALAFLDTGARSEERRVGKGCRSRWWAYH